MDVKKQEVPSCFLFFMPFLLDASCCGLLKFPPVIPRIPLSLILQRIGWEMQGQPM